MNKTRIVCYGDSNTWGYHAAAGKRYDDDERWTQRLGALLGEGYMVVEEGISGRTTVFDDPLFPALNGYHHFPAIAGAHCPMDLLVLMLGTNDCKERFSANAQNITDGLKRLVLAAKQMDIWYDTSRILVVAPIVIDTRVYDVPRIGQEMGARCAEKSKDLPPLMKKMAEENGCYYLDCNNYVHPGEADWMHFSADSNEPFAHAMAEKIREIFAKQPEKHA